MTMSKTKPYPFSYPSRVSEEPNPDCLDSRGLYEFHVAKAEHAKKVCDEIINWQEGRARWEIESGRNTLPYTVQVLAERYIANDLIFQKWSGKYRFHQARAVYLAQRVIIHQNDALLKHLSTPPIFREAT